MLQLQQYKSSSGQDDKPKENGTVSTGSPEENGEPTQTKVFVVLKLWG